MLTIGLTIDLKISNDYKSFIPNKTTFTKYCLTQGISKFHGSFEIHWVRQHLVNFMNLATIVNTTVYKTESIFTGLGHGKLSWFLTLDWSSQLLPWLDLERAPGKLWLPGQAGFCLVLVFLWPELRAHRSLEENTLDLHESDAPWECFPSHWIYL